MTADFPLRKKNNKKNMGLKHWILPNNQFKTHLFFSILGWGDPFQLRSWSEAVCYTGWAGFPVGPGKMTWACLFEIPGDGPGLSLKIRKF